MDPLPQLTTFLNNIQTWLYGLGSTFFILSVLVAGLLRMPIFGVSDRRNLISNMALGAAIIGLIIIFSAIPIANALKAAFPTR